MNAYHITAAALTLCVTAIHCFVGSKTDVRPLLNSNLPEPAKSTMYLCWHLVTILLLALTGLFIATIFVPNQQSLALAASIVSTVIATWCFVAALIREQSLTKEMPQAYMFAVISTLGWVGLL